MIACTEERRYEQKIQLSSDIVTSTRESTLNNTHMVEALKLRTTSDDIRIHMVHMYVQYTITQSTIVQCKTRQQ